MTAPALHDDVASLDDWRRLVDKSLKDKDFSTLQARTSDGILIAPLYGARSDALPLAGRGAPAWTIVQAVDEPDSSRANRQALEDLAGGATGLSLRFADGPSAGRSGLQPDAASLRDALAGIDLAAISLRIEPHLDGPETARLLKTMIAESGLAPERAVASFGLDPIGPAARHGRDVPSADRCADCFRELQAAGLRGPIAELDGRVFHEAGGTETQELAAVLAAAVWWLHALGDASALPLFGATLTVDRDQFVSIAKIRALRLLWARLTELCGTAPAQLRIHAETSRRMMTRTDPQGNLLRTTIAAFSAAIGGADSILVLPHTIALGLPDRGARALARNLQHLLKDEAHLDRVADPSAGAGALEALTDALAERAWMEFQAIEAEGGIAESLRASAFPGRIAAARDELAARLRAGQAPLVGATIYQAASTGTAAEHPALSSPPVGLAPVLLEELAAA